MLLVASIVRLIFPIVSLFPREKTNLNKKAFCQSILGYLPFTRENRKFQVEDQMVRAIPFGKLQKIWALICGDAIFLLF